MRELTLHRRILLKCAAVLSRVPEIPAIAQSLRLSRHDAARLEGLIRHHAAALGLLAAPRPPSPRAVTRFFREAHAVLPDLLLNAAADLMAARRTGGAIAGDPLLHRRAAAHARFRPYAQIALPSPDFRQRPDPRVRPETVGPFQANPGFNRRGAPVAQ